MTRARWETDRRRRLARLDEEIADLNRELEEKMDEYARLMETTYEDVAAEERVDRGRDL